MPRMSRSRQEALRATVNTEFFLCFCRKVQSDLVVVK